MSAPGSGAPAPVQSTGPQLSLMAIFAFIFTFVFAPVGLVLGVVALVQIRRAPHQHSGRGLAIAATAISAVGVLLMGGAVWIFYSPGSEFQRPDASGTVAEQPENLGAVFNRARESARRTQCLSNVKNLSMAARMWAEEHGGKLPDASRWVDELSPLVNNPEVFKCGADKSGARSSFGMNAALSGANVKMIDAARVVLFYETAHPGNDPAGGPEDVAPGRHPKEAQPGANYGFADGHAKWFASTERLPFKAR